MAFHHTKNGLPTVHRGQVFVAVTQMVLAELPGDPALALEHRRHRHVGGLPTLRCTCKADLGHAVSNGKRRL